MAIQPGVPARAQVFYTNELLETILLSLPMKDLLLSQGVSKSWRALTFSSIRLRRALFLEPVACGAISYIDWRLDDKDFYDENRAGLGLGEHLRGPQRDQAPKTYPAHWGKTRYDTGRYRVFVNPLLAEIFPVLKKNGVYWYEQRDDLPKAAQREYASWRWMYFTQPPVNFMAVEWDSSNDEEERMSEWTISSIRKHREFEGLMMDQLFGSLMAIGRPTWIEGNHLLDEYSGARDLARVVVEG